jgi:hypothetical protein
MSTSFLPASLTEPEKDMLAWYRLGPEPVQYPLRQVATIVSREPLAEDTPAASIDMPIAA